MKSLSISVVIPTYNRAHLLPRSIESALREMADGDELILVDDGSTDDTALVAARFGKQIRHIRIDNSGTGKARNVGINEASRDLVAFLDSDDEFMPGRLELPRRLLLARPEILFTFTDMAGTTKSGEVKRWFLQTWHKNSRPWEAIFGPGIDYSSVAKLPEGTPDFKVYEGNLYGALAHEPYVAAQTATVRREEAGCALYFDEDWPLYEDWGCFARLAKVGKAAFLNIETAWQHSHAGPRLTSTSALIHASTRVELLERIWGQDQEYLASSAEEYRSLLNYHRGLKARHLYALGRRAEAAREIRFLMRPSLLYRVLTMIPGPLIMVLAFLARHLKR